MRAVSSEGFGRIRYHETIRGLLDTDRSVRSFMDGETDRLPQFYTDRIKRELGPAYDYLPEGALMHDPNAYLHATTEPGWGRESRWGLPQPTDATDRRRGSGPRPGLSAGPPRNSKCSSTSSRSPSGLSPWPGARAAAVVPPWLPGATHQAPAQGKIGILGAKSCLPDISAAPSLPFIDVVRDPLWAPQQSGGSAAEPLRSSSDGSNGRRNRRLRKSVSANQVSCS